MISSNSSAAIRECVKTLSDPILAEHIKNLMKELVQPTIEGDEFNGTENQH